MTFSLNIDARLVHCCSAPWPNIPPPLTRPAARGHIHDTRTRPRWDSLPTRAFLCPFLIALKMSGIAVGAPLRIVNGAGDAPAAIWLIAVVVSGALGWVLWRYMWRR